MTFEEIENQIKQDFIIDEFDLGKEVLRNDNLFGKYLIFLKDERRKFERYDSQRKKLIFWKKQYYSGQLSDEQYEQFPLDKRYLKTELSDVLEADPDIIKINEKYNDSGLKLKLFEHALNRIKNRGYDIKTAMDYLKFTQGV